MSFAFQTGVRLGGLVAVHFSDIQGNSLHVQRTEVKYQEQTQDGIWKPAVRMIVDHVKSAAGNRRIYLTKDAMNIILLARKTIEKEGFSDEDYIFQDCSGRIPSRAVDSRIRKYCKHLSITQKSTHKVQMTYISTLIDAGLNINLIRQQVGHEDIFVKTNHINYTSHRILDHNFYTRTHSYVNKGMRVITVIIIL